MGQRRKKKTRDPPRRHTAAFEAMTGSSPPTFPPDVQCGIDICNNSGHNRDYLFTGDECQDLNPPQNESYLTACYLEDNWDCVYIWNDLDDPYDYHIRHE